MASMQGSGVYLRETDESFKSYDSVSLGLMVPMMLKRGKLNSLIDVSASDFKSKVGYDLNYNSNYLGLSSLLESYSKVKLFRLNKDPYYGNVVVFKDGKFAQVDKVTDPVVLEAALCLKSVTGTASTVSVSISLEESVKKGTYKFLVGGVQWAHDDGSSGALVVDGTHAGFSGSVNYTTGAVAITLPSGTSFPLDYESQYEHDTSISFIAYMESPGDWDKLAVRASRYYEALEAYATAASYSITLTDALFEAPGSYRLEDIAGNVIATSGAVTSHSAPITGTGITGTVNFATGAIALTFDAATYPAAKFPLYIKHRYILSEAHFLFEVLRKVTVGAATSYVVLESARASFIPTAADYLANVPFANVTFAPKAELLTTKVGDPAPVDLLYGNDGTFPSAAGLSFTGLPTSGYNLVCLNGLLGASLASKFVEYFGKGKGKLILLDCPNVQTSVAAVQYAESVVASEYRLAYWRGDFVASGVKSYCIYPSVKAALAYALMFKKTGTLNYPPAGYQFAAVAAENLLVTDAEDNIQYLKLHKVNHILNGPSGPVIWEQRTGYAAESDLSYASTRMILTALGARLQAFQANYNFRFITADVLVSIKTGLEAISADYQSQGFTWKCDFAVPTFDEIKAAGARSATIPGKVKVAEDGEEFTFDLHIVATA